MIAETGIGLAFAAMLCWGIGDFLIQKSTRRIGDWETLLAASALGVLILLPFSYKRIPDLVTGRDPDIWIMLASAAALLVASLLYFEGLRRGKMSVAEPMLSFEIPSAALLAFWVLGDSVSWIQTGLIIALIAGLFLVSFRDTSIVKRFLLEKGVVLAFIGAALMGVADFFLGWGARVDSPLVAVFVFNAAIFVVACLYLGVRGHLFRSIRDILANKGILIVMAITENVAWVAYAVAMSLVAIAVATGLSESSIIIAVALGFIVNRERIQLHQKIGLGLAIVAAITLASVTG